MDFLKLRQIFSNPWIAITAACLILFGMSAYHILHMDLWRDEAWTVMVTDVPEGMTYSEYYWNHILPIDNNPPLYYFLMRMTAVVTGENIMLWRFMALFAMVLTVPLVYLLGRQWGLHKGAVIAAAIFALSLEVQAFANEVRTYSYLSLVMLLALLQVRPITMGEKLPLRVFLLTLFCFIGFMMNYIFLFLIAGIGYFFLFRLKEKKERTASLAALGALGFLCLGLLIFWIPIVRSQSDLYTTEIVRFSLRRAFLGFGTFFPFPIPFLLMRYWGLLLLLLLLVFLAPKALKGNIRSQFLLCTSVGTAITLVIIGIKEPFFLTRERYFIVCFPAICLFFGSHVLLLKRNHFLILMGFALASLTFFHARDSFPPRTFYQELFAHLKAQNPDFIVYYAEDRHAQTLNSIYYNGMKDLDRWIVWHTVNPDRPKPNLPFRHKVREYLENHTDMPRSFSEIDDFRSVTILIEQSMINAEIDGGVRDLYNENFELIHSAGPYGSGRRAFHVYTYSTRDNSLNDRTDSN